MNNFSENGGTPLGQYRANERDVAWLAGILDGEGSISAHWAGGVNRSSIQATIWLCNTDMSMLLKAQRIIQSITHKKYNICASKQHGIRNYVYYRMSIGDQRGCWRICEAILPDVTCKRSQALAMIEFCKSRQERRHVDKSYSEREKEIVSELKRLKRCDLTPYVQGVEHKREAPLCS